MPKSELMHSSVGRLVQGSLYELNTTDHKNQPLPADKHHYWFAVAIRKDDPQVNTMLQNILAHAYQCYAQHPHVQAVLQQFDLRAQSGFSWKIKDGDTPDEKGQINENTAGCWIFQFRNGYPIKCADQQNAEISPDQIKRGYFVDLAYTVSENGNTDTTAGIYLNPVCVRLVAFGKEIQGGMTPEQAFAGQALPTALPPGASLTPLATGPMAVGGQPAHGQPPMQQGLPGATPTAPMNTPSTTGAPIDPQTMGVQPNANFANGPMAQGAPVAAPQGGQFATAAPGMPAQGTVGVPNAAAVGHVAQPGAPMQQPGIMPGMTQ